MSVKFLLNNCHTSRVKPDCGKNETCQAVTNYEIYIYLNNNETVHKNR